MSSFLFVALMLASVKTGTTCRLPYGGSALMLHVKRCRFSSKHHHCSNTTLFWLQDSMDSGPVGQHNFIYRQISGASLNSAVKLWPIYPTGTGQQEKTKGFHIYEVFYTYLVLTQCCKKKGKQTPHRCIFLPLISTVFWATVT